MLTHEQKASLTSMYIHECEMPRYDLLDAHLRKLNLDNLEIQSFMSEIRKGDY